MRGQGSKRFLQNDFLDKPMNSLHPKTSYFILLMLHSYVMKTARFFVVPLIICFCSLQGFSNNLITNKPFSFSENKAEIFQKHLQKLLKEKDQIRFRGICQSQTTASEKFMPEDLARVWENLLQTTLHFLHALSSHDFDSSLKSLLREILTEFTLDVAVCGQTQTFLNESISQLKMILDSEVSLSDDSFKDLPASDLESIANSELEKNLNEISLQFIWPLNEYGVTSFFGYRKDPIQTHKVFFHNGIDLITKHDSSVFASESGFVSFAGLYGGYGNRITLYHSAGYVSDYGHLKQILVKSGQTVVQGDLIGIIGSSGKSTGTHLHFSLYRNRIPINPIAVLGQRLHLTENVSP